MSLNSIGILKIALIYYTSQKLDWMIIILSFCPRKVDLERTAVYFHSSDAGLDNVDGNLDHHFHSYSEVLQCYISSPVSDCETNFNKFY